MNGILLTGVGALIAITVVGGLAWRNARQRRSPRRWRSPPGTGSSRNGSFGSVGSTSGSRSGGRTATTRYCWSCTAGRAGPTRSSPCPSGPGSRTSQSFSGTHRGVGKTLGRTGKAGSGETFDRRVADAIEVIEFLRQCLDKDKVVLLAESMGTLTGMPLVTRRFFLFQGETDVVTLTSLATEYFEEVQAPTRGLARIKHARHFAASPNRTGSWPNSSPGYGPWLRGQLPRPSARRDGHRPHRFLPAFVGERIARAPSGRTPRRRRGVPEAR